jgi:signal transduction histidine kinase
MVVANASPLALERHIALQVEAREPVTLWGDEARLIQVIMNLLDNALHYTDAGGQVTLSVGARGGKVSLCVRDTGKGIAPEHLPHIFERFYRGDRAHTQRQNGQSGLGLSIVAWVVQAHGGEVTVESQVGKGSSFLVTLPMDRAGATSRKS